MPSLSEYFERERPKPFFEFGTRVFGKYNKIPFMGTVYGDGMINEEQGPRLSIHLDLPISVDGTLKHIIIDTYDKFKDIVELTDLEDTGKTKGKSFNTHTKNSKKPKPAEKSRSSTLLENLKRIRQ